LVLDRSPWRRDETGLLLDETGLLLDETASGRQRPGWLLLESGLLLVESGSLLAVGGSLRAQAGSLREPSGFLRVPTGSLLAETDFQRAPTGSLVASTGFLRVPTPLLGEPGAACMRPAWLGLRYDGTVPRFVVCLVATTLAGAVACTTFAFPAPTGSSPDASSDGNPTDGSAGDGGATTSFLDVTSAARVCSLTFKCPQLAAAIEASLVIPVATPATPLNFSGCVDWLAGPISQNRPGLLEQQQVLTAMASAATCEAAFTPLGLQPGDAAVCTLLSCAGADLETCTPASGPLLSACGAPQYSEPGTCVTTTAASLCMSPVLPVGQTCVFGASCPTPAILDQCHTSGTSHTEYNCALSGRQCSAAAGDCVGLNKTTPPCSSKLDSYDGCGTTSVVHCVPGLLSETEFDCRAVDRDCSTASGAARCVGANDTCTPFDSTVNTCSGTSVNLCVGGSKVSFDCASIGQACQPESGSQTAHCG
jgi:hypothetical protein